MTRRARTVALALALYGVVLGFLGGLLVERLLFDRQRTSVLTRVAAAEKRLHARLMEIERQQDGPALPTR
jgi:Na+/glutamate symporter